MLRPSVAPGMKLTGILVVAVVLAPLAAAHGAAPAREVDTRVLLDDDGLTGYGPDACAPAVGTCPFGNGAPDLLSLDLREAATPTGQPVLWFRVAFQTNAVPGPRAIHLALTAGGKERAFDWTSADGATFTTSTFTAIAGPTPIGDGHPQALDGMVGYDALGLKVGDRLEGLSAESHGGGEDGDRMPGGWTSQGTEVAPVPNPAGAEPAYDGTYTLKGPAALLKVTAAGALDLAGKGTMLHVENLLAASAQFVTLSLSAPPGVLASLDSATLALEGGAVKMAGLKLANATGDGVLNVTVTSDLGAHAFLLVPYRGTAPLVPNATSPAPPSTSSSKASPPALPLLAVAAAVVLARRRQGFAVSR
ncbi:MAG: hypothetical protein QOG31_52 [Thermoplasmata archaeon]|jgi:MYXO-CTERM domain-containing protein|nr:hypothetical protein [Thermoplasmata archaeon]